MLNILNNDSKIQMKQNIQLHRQKLLQFLEKTNDTFIKPKIKSVSNGLEKNASTTEFQKPKRSPPTIGFTNFKNKQRIRTKKYEPVLNTKAKNHEVLTGNNVKKGQTRSSNTVNQLQPNNKINKREEPLSNVKLKLEPLPKNKIDLPNMEIRDLKPPVIVKKLKEQLIEELFDSSSSEEVDDNISVGNNDDWNEIYQTHNENNYENEISAVSSNSSLKGVPYDEHQQLANAKSKEEYLYYSGDSENSVLDINYPTTTKTSRTRKRTRLTKSTYQTKHRFRKPQDRSIHNAKERACREHIARRFDILKKCCSYLNTNRRVASKHSILLAAKKECDLLNHFEEKMIVEKKVLVKANEVLKKRIAELHRNNDDNSNLACLN